MLKSRKYYNLMWWSSGGKDNYIAIGFPLQSEVMAVSAEMIKETQSSLGQFVKKPPLTEKLLNKPPFRYNPKYKTKTFIYMQTDCLNFKYYLWIINTCRFLHDVISAVIIDTGALSGRNKQLGFFLVCSVFGYYFLDQTTHF